MKSFNFKNFAILFMWMLLTSVSLAADNKQTTLENKNIQRDKALIELLERIRVLEKRAGVLSAVNEPGDALAQNTTSSTTSLALPPGAVVIEEGAAERALERSLTREGALLLAPGVLEMEPSISFVRQEESRPGLLNIDDALYSSKLERNENSLTSNVSLRLGLPWNAQLEIGLPYRWSRLEFVTPLIETTTVTKQSNAAVGDLRLGLAKSLLREGLWQPDLVARFTWLTDTGSTEGFQQLRASLTTIKRQDPVTFIGGLSYGYSLLNNNIRPGAVIAGNFGSLIALSPETSMRFIFSASYQQETLSANTKIIGSDRSVANFIIGGSTLLMPGTLLNLSTSMGLTRDAADISVTLSLLMRLNKRLF